MVSIREAEERKTNRTRRIALVVTIAAALIFVGVAVWPPAKEALAVQDYSVFVQDDDGQELTPLEGATVEFRFWDDALEEWSVWEEAPESVSPGLYKLTNGPNLTTWEARINAPEIDQFNNPNQNPTQRIATQGPTFDWYVTVEL